MTERVSNAAPPDFRRIYETYHGKVRSYAARLVGPNDADDVANDVFAKIARSLGTLADTTRLTTWVYTITLNTARDRLRSRTAGADHLAEIPCERLSEIAADRARSPEEAAARNEMVACYLDYVNRLPHDHHEVYVLSEFEELSNAEIARRLSVSLATVKIRLHRARARLYEDLRRHCRCYHNERGELMGEPKRDEQPPEGGSPRRGVKSA